jgi:Ca2+-binding EF-hand superfamily protein
LTPAELEAVLSALDSDSDGRISLREFETFVNNADDLMHAMLEVRRKSGRKGNTLSLSRDT